MENPASYSGHQQSFQAEPHLITTSNNAYIPTDSAFDFGAFQEPSISRKSQDDSLKEAHENGIFFIDRPIHQGQYVPTKWIRMASWKKRNPLTMTDVCWICNENFVNPFFCARMDYKKSCVTFACKKCTQIKNWSTETVSFHEKKRLTLWLSYFQFKRIVDCPLCCINKIDCISSSWHAGHDKAKNIGGTTDMYNLLPICSDCNACMAENSMYDFAMYIKRFGIKTSEWVRPKILSYVDVQFLLESLQNS